jgi:hypothetical protein
MGLITWAFGLTPSIHMLDRRLTTSMNDRKYTDDLLF